MYIIMLLMSVSQGNGRRRSADEGGCHLPEGSQSEWGREIHAPGAHVCRGIRHGERDSEGCQAGYIRVSVPVPLWPLELHQQVPLHLQDTNER